MNMPSTLSNLTGKKNKQVSKPSSPIRRIIAETVDIVSSSSQYSLKEMNLKNSSFEKVNSWLDGGCEGRNEQGRGECCNINTKYSPSCLNYPSITDKVQALLYYGEYSLFRKWVILIEGDFVQIRFNETGNSELVQSSRNTSEVTVLNVTKKKKCSLRDIRSIALTKNWLVVCHMQRTYQVDKDGLMPAGVFLQLRRLVPLKFLKIRVSRSAQKVIAIENQSGLIKKYRLIERSSADGDEQIAGWKRVINSLEPNHDDDTLLTTLRMYERWSQQYSCRITVYPSAQKHSGSLASLAESIEKPPKRNAPLPPQKNLNLQTRSCKGLRSPSSSPRHKEQNNFLRQKTSKHLFSESRKQKEVTCYPGERDKNSTRPAEVQPQASSHVKSGPKAGYDRSNLSAERNQASSSSLLKEKPSSYSRRKQPRHCDQKNDHRDIGKKFYKREKNKQPDISPPPYGARRVTSESGSTFSYLVGCDVSIGGSRSMTLSQSSEPVIGIETSVGPSRPMSNDSEFETFPRPSTSSEVKKPKKSVKDVFKMGLFLSKKSRKKSSLATATKSVQPFPSPEPQRNREFKRRTSRLDMGIPIEEVFSGVEFATIDKKIPSSSKQEDAGFKTQNHSDENLTKTESRPLPSDDILHSKNSSCHQEYSGNDWNLGDIPEDLT